jgi:hypothetical protein
MRPFRSRVLTALVTAFLFLGLLGSVALADEIPTTSFAEDPGDHSAAPTMSFPEDPWPGPSLPMSSFPEDPWPDLN